MKLQPLNLEKMKEETSDTSEKLDKLQKTYWDFDTIEEVKQRIRLAIQGLLKELEEDITYWKKEMVKYEEKFLNAKNIEEKRKYDEYWKVSEQVYRVLEKRIKNLIKKWLSTRIQNAIAEITKKVNDVKSACKFYLRYRDKPELLIKEHPEYKEKVNSIKLRFVSENSELVDSMMWHYLSDYNEWLFKLAFKSILDEKNETQNS